MTEQLEDYSLTAPTAPGVQLVEKITKAIPWLLGGIVVIAIATSGGARSVPPTKDAWFRATVLDCKTPVVVKFGAEWCGPCRAMDEALGSLKGQFSSRARFVQINVDEKPELFQHYGSGSGIPQIKIFDKGQIIASKRGFGGEQDLEDWLKSSL